MQLMSSFPEETNQRRKLLLLGTEGVGKTHLVHQLKGENPPEKIQSTIGITQHNIGNESAPISLTDTSGQDRFAFAWQELAKKQNMHYCLVYSSDAPKSLKTLTKIVQEIKELDKKATFCLIQINKTTNTNKVAHEVNQSPVTEDDINTFRIETELPSEVCPLQTNDTDKLGTYFREITAPPFQSQGDKVLLTRALEGGILKQKKDRAIFDSQNRANTLHDYKNSILENSETPFSELQAYMKILTYPSYTAWDKKGATTAFMSFLKGVDSIEDKKWQQTFLKEVKTALEMLENNYTPSKALSRENFSVSKALSLVGAAIEALPQPHNMGAAEPNTH